MLQGTAPPGGWGGVFEGFDIAANNKEDAMDQLAAQLIAAKRFKSLDQVADMLNEGYCRRPGSRCRPKTPNQKPFSQVAATTTTPETSTKVDFPYELWENTAKNFLGIAAHNVDSYRNAFFTFADILHPESAIGDKKRSEKLCLYLSAAKLVKLKTPQQCQRHYYRWIGFNARKEGKPVPTFEELAAKYHWPIA